MKNNNRIIRKITAILLLCSFTVLCGCSSEIGTESNNASEYGQYLYEDDDGQEMQLIDTRFSTKSYEEYLEYVKNTDLPDWFVEYEGAISQIGEFVRFKAAFWERNDASFFYILKDKNVNDMFVCFNRGKFENKYNRTIMKSVSNGYDMRTTTTEGSYFYYKDLIYRYAGGELGSITIVISDDLYVYINVSSEEMELINYPLDKDTFLGRLLNVFTAEEAAAELKAAINK